MNKVPLLERNENKTTTVISDSILRTRMQNTHNILSHPVCCPRSAFEHVENPHADVPTYSVPKRKRKRRRLRPADTRIRKSALHARERRADKLRGIYRFGVESSEAGNWD